MKVNILFILGWQTRWFILDNGILSYYKSQDEVNQGCKGSLKVQACQINGKFQNMYSNCNKIKKLFSSKPYRQYKIRLGNSRRTTFIS